MNAKTVEEDVSEPVFDLMDRLPEMLFGRCYGAHLRRCGISGNVWTRGDQYHVRRCTGVQPRPGPCRRDPRAQLFAAFGTEADSPREEGLDRGHPVVIAATFPIVLPFMLISDVGTAKMVSRGVALAMLFFGGFVIGRYAGYGSWKAGLVMLGTGTGLVMAITGKTKETSNECRTIPS